MWMWIADFGNPHLAHWFVAISLENDSGSNDAETPRKADIGCHLAQIVPDHDKAANVCIQGSPRQNSWLISQVMD